MGRREVEMITRLLLQPPADQRCFVGPVIIEHQMNVEIGWNRTVYLLQEVQELHRTVAPVTLAEHISSGDIERSKQARDAVPLVIMGASLLLPGPHGQDRLSPAECLNLRLL